MKFRLLSVVHPEVKGDLDELEINTRKKSQLNIAINRHDILETVVGVYNFFPSIF
jgi:hypothetical protein